MSQGNSGNLVASPTRPPARAAALRLYLVLPLLAFSCTEALASERTPVEQLQRMAEAQRSLSYEGTVVYLHGQSLEALHIVHRIIDGQIHEQLTSLNGPVRTLTREKGSVTCELSGSHRISVPEHDVGKDMLHAWKLDPRALSTYYRVYPLGAARVAGRRADVVGIIPKDRLRYGYRFYLGRETGLPLKSDLMGQQRDPIEQIMFTSLDLLPSQGVSLTAGNSEAHQPVSEPRDGVRLSWRFDSLPPGFALVMHDDGLDAGGKPVEHLVLSDGLASISIYIESDPGEGLIGGTSIGAVHAVGNRVAGHQVTIVGEVPSDTVEAVLAGIRYDPGESP
jgi:sigma-E factor negative regulatory protein RseB